MAQTRIVVRKDILERGQQLLKTTKLGSLTELFNVLIARYGDHLESTWIMPAVTCRYPVQESLSEVQAMPALTQQTDIDIDEPLTGI